MLRPAAGWNGGPCGGGGAAAPDGIRGQGSAKKPGVGKTRAGNSPNDGNNTGGKQVAGERHPGDPTKGRKRPDRKAQTSATMGRVVPYTNTTRGKRSAQRASSPLSPSRVAETWTFTWNYLDKHVDSTRRRPLDS